MSDLSGNKRNWIFVGDGPYTALTYEEWISKQELDSDSEHYDHIGLAGRLMFDLPKIIDRCRELFSNRQPGASLDSVVFSVLKPIVEGFPETSKSPAFLDREHPGFDEPYLVRISTSDTFITDHYCRGSRVYSKRISSFANLPDPDRFLCPFISAYSPFEPCVDYQGLTGCYNILGGKPVSGVKPPIYDLHPNDRVRMGYYPATSSCTEISMERPDVEMAQRVLMYKHSIGGHAQSPAAIQREVRNNAFKICVQNSKLIDEDKREGSKHYIAQYAMCPAPDCPYCLLMTPIPHKHQEVSAEQIVGCLKKYCHRCVPGISDKAFSDASFLNNLRDSFAPLSAEELCDFTISRGLDRPEASPDPTDLELELYDRHVKSDHFPMRIIINQEPRFAKCRAIRCNVCIRAFISERDYALCSKHPNGFVPAAWAKRMPTSYLDAAPIPLDCVCENNDSIIGVEAMESLSLFEVQEIVAEVKNYVVSVHREYEKLLEDHAFCLYLDNLSITLEVFATDSPPCASSMDAMKRSKAVKAHAMEIAADGKFVAAYKELRDKGQTYKIPFDIPDCPSLYYSQLKESDNMDDLQI